jgi:hypothetical protein
MSSVSAGVCTRMRAFTLIVLLALLSSVPAFRLPTLASKAARAHKRILACTRACASDVDARVSISWFCAFTYTDTHTCMYMHCVSLCVSIA